MLKQSLVQQFVGVVQKNGKNYGLPIINVEKIDKKKIKLETLLLDKIDFLELWLFDKNDNNKKLGIAKLDPRNEISIDYLVTQIKDDNKKAVKFKYNKEYEFKIYSYSKEINGIKYISVSDNFILYVKKYKLLPL